MVINPFIICTNKKLYALIVVCSFWRKKVKGMCQIRTGRINSVESTPQVKTEFVPSDEHCFDRLVETGQSSRYTE